MLHTRQISNCIHTATCEEHAKSRSKDTAPLSGMSLTIPLPSLPCPVSSPCLCVRRRNTRIHKREHPSTVFTCMLRAHACFPPSDVHTGTDVRSAEFVVKPHSLQARAHTPAPLMFRAYSHASDEHRDEILSVHSPSTIIFDLHFSRTKNWGRRPARTLAINRYS